MPLVVLSLICYSSRMSEQYKSPNQYIDTTTEEIVLEAGQTRRVRVDPGYMGTVTLLEGRGELWTGDDNVSNLTLEGQRVVGIMFSYELRADPGSPIRVLSECVR